MHAPRSEGITDASGSIYRAGLQRSLVIEHIYPKNEGHSALLDLQITSEFPSIYHEKEIK